MATKINKSDFLFASSGSGSYVVTYISPVTFKRWMAVVTCMPMIDATRNCDEPKVKDLEELKRFVKRNAIK